MSARSNPTATPSSGGNSALGDLDERRYGWSYDFIQGLFMFSASTSLRAAFAAAVLSTTLFAGSAFAADRRVEISNDTSYTIVEFYASNVGEKAWEEDILGRDMLAPGESVVINI